MLDLSLICTQYLVQINTVCCDSVSISTKIKAKCEVLKTELVIKESTQH